MEVAPYLGDPRSNHCPHALVQFTDIPISQILSYTILDGVIFDGKLCVNMRAEDITVRGEELSPQTWVHRIASPAATYCSRPLPDGTGLCGKPLYLACMEPHGILSEIKSLCVDHKEQSYRWVLNCQHHDPWTTLRASKTR